MSGGWEGDDGEDEEDSGDSCDVLWRNERGQAILFIADSGHFVNMRLARLSTAQGLSMSTCHGGMVSCQLCVELTDSDFGMRNF
jgi:hypothetical protein